MWGLSCHSQWEMLCGMGELESTEPRISLPYSRQEGPGWAGCCLV